jgi:hypothetical protein
VEEGRIEKWLEHAVQCSAVQCSAVQCSAVQCSAVQCSAVPRAGSIQLHINEISLTSAEPAYSQQCSAVQYFQLSRAPLKETPGHYPPPVTSPRAPASPPAALTGVLSADPLLAGKPFPTVWRLMMKGKATLPRHLAVVCGEGRGVGGVVKPPAPAPWGPSRPEGPEGVQG